MKKFKRIVPFLLALIMALAIPLAGCNSCGKDKGNGNGEKTVTLKSISVDASGAKTQYSVGDGFTSKGLIVTAVLSDSEEAIALGADDYEVDSSAFNGSVPGKYTVKVSYTYNEVTKDDSYSVTVLPAFYGLKVALTAGTQDTFTLSAPPQNTVEIDTTKITVNEVNEDGTVGNAATGYTTRLFLGQEEITIPAGGKVTVTGGGAYAIWAEKAADDVYGFDRSGFVLIYVDDAITGFELNEGGVFTQQAGIDAISKTWKFTATYVSGTTREVSSEQCVYSVDTITAGENKRTTVTYTDYTATGKSTVRTVDVTYTVTQAYGKTTYTYNYALIDNSQMPAVGGDKTVLKQSDFKGENSFLTLAGADVQYRNKEKWGSVDALEVKGAAFYVTFAGTGRLTIGFCSTSSSNKSDLGVKDSSNKFIAATGSPVGVEASKTSNVYAVKGTSAATVTFEITKPGRYSIVTGTDNGRATRIHSIVMEDNVEAPATAAKNVYYVDNKRFN